MADIVSMADNLFVSRSFTLKGRLYTFTVLQLLSTHEILLRKQLEEVTRKAPKLFDRTPVVLDCSTLQEDEIDLQSLCLCLREYGMLPVAIQGANPFVETLAQCQGLAVLHGSSVQDKLLIMGNEEQLEKQPIIKSKLQTAPVRSGQQLVSKGGDLTVTASVSPGAELLADGTIHIYGALRGRALAGISGDRQARIFCLSLEAELISIAGFYRLSDEIEPQFGPCQIYLQDEHLQIERL